MGFQLFDTTKGGRATPLIFPSMPGFAILVHGRADGFAEPVPASAATAPTVRLPVAG